MILPHNYAQADEQERSVFRNYLSRLFRTPPNIIDNLIADCNAADGIWESLKGLTGVTAKCNPANITSGGHGIQMGGLVLMAAAHCPKAGEWIGMTQFTHAPGISLLSNHATPQNEIDLWKRLHDFLRAIVPKKRSPRESSLKMVILEKERVCIQMNAEHFCPANFSDGLAKMPLGDACSGFESLHQFLNKSFSKSTLTWERENARFVFRKKSG